MNLRLDWCSHEAAKYACLNWHYSRTIPTGKNNYIGVWEDNQYIGAIIFGLGATGTMGKPYGLTTFQIAELVRVALTKHKTPVTKMVAFAIKLLKNKNPGLRILISFADPYHGHNGSIYQAGNWFYTGASGVGDMYLLPNGELVHPRRYTGRGWNNPQPIPQGAKKIKTPGKHRYLMPLDDEMRKQIEPLRQPYPKRPKQATPPDQGDSGGAAPTRTLQNISR